MFYKDRLILLRNRIGITQKDLANILEIDNRHYGNCEREYEILPLKHLNSLCNYFNVSFDYMFSFTEIKQYQKNVDTLDTKISGQKLKEFRKENKLTQAKLATVLNTNQSVIANYERGRTIIATPFLYTICNKYHISADYLLGKIEEPKYIKKS